MKFNKIRQTDELDKANKLIGSNKTNEFWSEPELEKTSSMQSFQWVYPEQEAFVLGEKHKKHTGNKWQSKRH